MSNSTSDENFNSFNYWQFSNSADDLVFDDVECEYLSDVNTLPSCYYYEMKFDNSTTSSQIEIQKNLTAQNLITTTRFLHPSLGLQLNSKNSQQPNNLVVNDLIDIYDLTDDLDKGFLVDESVSADTGVFSRFRNLIGLSNISCSRDLTPNCSLTPTGILTRIRIQLNTYSKFEKISSFE